MVDSETTHWSPLYYQPRKILTQPAGHGKQDIPSHPHPAFADFSAIPEREQLFWFTHTRTAIPGVSIDGADFCLAISVMFIWHSQICHSNTTRQPPEQAKGILYSVYQFLFHPRFLPLPAHSPSLSLPSSTYHSSSLSVSRFPVLRHELSVLPAMPIIAPCSGAENRGVKSQMCGARLFSTLHPFFVLFFSCVTCHPGLFVKFWLFIAVCGILISSYI